MAGYNHKNTKWTSKDESKLRRLYEQGLSATEISSNMPAFSSLGVYKKIRKLRFRKRTTAEIVAIHSRDAKRRYGNGRPNMQGSNHFNFKGGFIAGGRASYHFTYMPQHPFAVHGGKYISTHRLVMERKIGRYLTNKDIVHHINGDKLDNRPENLQLLSSNAEHRRIHAEMRRSHEQP